jgi:hypothetical protein
MIQEYGEEKSLSFIPVVRDPRNGIWGRYNNEV